MSATAASAPLPIRSATVVGAGIMGAQIAAHLAGCGLDVLLLDVPAEGANRNALADRGKEGLRKIKPSPFYAADALDRIATGNTADHLEAAGKTDWIIEAIVELPDPKRDLFRRLEAVMGPDTLLSSNTSGIPLKILSRDLGASAGERFLGTHFFNPPRYLRLVEVIRGPLTSQATVDRIDHVLNALNKVAVPALDSPAFIANRVGVHAMAATLKLARSMGLSVEEVDSLSGPLLGRPKTGTFRLADLVGLDTLAHILKGLQAAFPGDIFAADPILQTLVDRKTLGKKSGAGFYRKRGDALETLDLNTGDYRPEIRARFEELKSAAKEESLEKKLRAVFAAKGRGAEAAQRILASSVAYAASVASSVAENAAYLDEAMELGFGWEAGPFKIADMLGAETLRDVCSRFGIDCPAWLFEAVEGDTKIYRREAAGIAVKKLPGSPGGMSGGRRACPERGFDLALHRAISQPVIASADATLWDMGDRVLLLEFHSKMNTMGPVSLDMILRSVDALNRPASGYAGLVIGNQGAHFCAGANIAMVLLDAVNGEYDNIDAAIRRFQAASMAIKYSSRPVVVAPHNLALGGGCEFVLHSNRPVLSPETYLGLVEAGVGLLPAGGGTKELAVRALKPVPASIPLNRLIKAFELIAMAKVSTSAREAFGMGYLDDRGTITPNESTHLDHAQAEVLALKAAGYRPPPPMKRIEMLGNESLAAFEAGIYMMREAGYASEHDARIGMAVGRILSGGNVVPGTVVDEEYLLELEREEFLKLVGTRKSQERIEHMLKTGKALRN